MTPNQGTLDSKLQEFRIWAMTLGRYSPSTVKRAVRRIRSFSRVMDLFNPNQEKLLNFFASEIEKGVKPHTINNQRKDLAAWFRFLNISIEMPKIREPPVPDPWIPSDDEAMALMNAASKLSRRKEINLRNSIIAYLAFFGGIRVGEMVQINVNDLMDNGIRIRSEKGEAERIIGLPDEILEDVRRYIRDYRPSSDPTALFTTPRGRMTYDYVRNLVKRIGAFTGIRKFHWHAARHWCATALLKGYRGAKPMDIRMVQIHLGHRSLRTTQRYTHVSQHEVAEVVRSRIGEIFQGSEKMIESVQIDESGPRSDGAARIWTGVSGSQSP